ncbi:hypothetical protein K431DRAFT_313736 [Polychaeton citri CBS 116435]|uniref:Uncharacterized protein n=1 Tax=Polychaeton citri CBS 116435 TaxID=1314669 RepID=A0A9P4Q5H4_9PEZI|nr:hypothetical protein K431DRAFT_313736 [Polychaeton citri CBS 116435]
METKTMHTPPASEWSKTTLAMTEVQTPIQSEDESSHPFSDQYNAWGDEEDSVLSPNSSNPGVGFQGAQPYSTLDMLQSNGGFADVHHPPVIQPVSQQNETLNATPAGPSTAVRSFTDTTMTQQASQPTPVGHSSQQ